MKAQAQFWPLLKNELAFSRMGNAGAVAGTFIVYWLAVGMLPLLLLFRSNAAQSNIPALFEAGLLPILASLMLAPLTFWITYATVPAFSQLLAPGGSVPGAIQHGGAFEFMFTRAVDRCLLFRARSTALLIFALAPLFLNVLVSPLAPPVFFDPPDYSSAESVSRHSYYMEAFPAARSSEEDQLDRLENHRAPIVPGRSYIPHGAAAFAAWLTWSATLAFLLLQAYGTLVARWVKPNNWWTALYAVTPILLISLAFGIEMRGSLRKHCLTYEDSFLFFSTHPLAMVVSLIALAAILQVWCERRFCKLEIL